MPGDWICTSCDNNNFAKRRECRRCGAPRGPQSQIVDDRRPPPPIPRGGGGPVKGLVPGDWYCSRCSNHNFQWRTECTILSCPFHSRQRQTLRGPEIRRVPGHRPKWTARIREGRSSRARPRTAPRTLGSAAAAAAAAATYAIFRGTASAYTGKKMLLTFLFSAHRSSAEPSLRRRRSSPRRRSSRRRSRPQAPRRRHRSTERNRRRAHRQATQVRSPRHRQALVKEPF